MSQSHTPAYSKTQQTYNNCWRIYQKERLRWAAYIFAIAAVSFAGIALKRSSDEHSGERRISWYLELPSCSLLSCGLQILSTTLKMTVGIVQTVLYHTVQQIKRRGSLCVRETYAVA